MVRMTPRDETALEWFALVRLTNMEGVRWLLGAVNGWDRPVKIRQAQSWVARMESIGRVGRARTTTVGGSLVWATHDVVGKPAPDLYRQTTRHEVSVSLASARYVAAGWNWATDRRARSKLEHQADGVAYTDDEAVMIEVELTPKQRPRYARIFRAMVHRMDDGEVSGVTYLCTPDSARAVRGALDDAAVGSGVRGRIKVYDVFDRTGAWDEENLPEWLTNLRVPEGTREDQGSTAATPVGASPATSLWVRNGGQNVE